MFVMVYIGGLIIFISLILWGIQNGKLRIFFQTHPLIPKILILGYIIFAGCFVFPIQSERFPLNVPRIYRLISSYGVIALALTAILGEGKGVIVYIVTFLLTAIGMGCRYFLEFGEVSNTYNFTLLNIISYLVIVPIGTTVAYQWLVKMLKKGSSGVSVGENRP